MKCENLTIKSPPWLINGELNEQEKPSLCHSRSFLCHSRAGGNPSLSIRYPLHTIFAFTPHLSSLLITVFVTRTLQLSLFFPN